MKFLGRGLNRRWRLRGLLQIGKDFYEDLTVEKLSALIDSFAAGEVPVPGPQNGRFSSEALGGATALADLKGGEEYNGSVARAAPVISAARSAIRPPPAPARPRRFPPARRRRRARAGRLMLLRVMN